ncbi:MAG: DsbA family protein [Haloarculaceae archaeon]
MENRGKSPTRRQVLAGVTSGIALSTAGCLGSGGGDLPTETPTGPVSTAPIPDSPGDYTYATAGTGDAPVQVTYFGNWKCPFCADFSTGFLADIVTDYVEPGTVDLTFRALSYAGNGDPFLGKDAPRAARAGLAVWNVDPGSYWRFHEYVMQNQPPESKTWADTDTLVTMAENAGVSDPDAVESALSNGKYEKPVRQNTKAAAQAGIAGTPTLVVGGTTVNPIQSQERVRELISQAQNETATPGGGTGNRTETDG